MKKDKDHTTEQQILEAAETLFYERGYAMTHTTDIARMVGCNQALVHYYFRTKEKLFESFFESKVRLFIMALVNSGDEEKDFESKLKKKIEVHFDMLRNHPRLPFLLFNEISTNPKKVEEYKTKLGDMPSLLLESLDKELEKQARLGNIIKISAIDLLITIISMNAIMFVASPIFKALTNAGEKEYEMMLDKRRSLNVEIILKYLKP
jgi:AcrR family transcriptional regulator